MLLNDVIRDVVKACGEEAEILAYAGITVHPFGYSGVVLVNRRTKHHPFVTWRTNNLTELHHGNYWQSLDVAKADFLKRAAMLDGYETATAYPPDMAD